jgi:hypothetical protein
MQPPQGHGTREARPLLQLHHSQSRATAAAVARLSAATGFTAADWAAACTAAAAAPVTHGLGRQRRIDLRLCATAGQRRASGQSGSENSGTRPASAARLPKVRGGCYRRPICGLVSGRARTRATA